MTYLLDVNVLIALIDPAHMQHNAAHRWFAAEGRQSWATCPLTENGVMRIVGHPRYPNSIGVPAVAELIRVLIKLPGHTFWAADVSLLDARRIEPRSLLTCGQLTDSYLLALAVAHHGRLATFDRKLVSHAVRHGTRGLKLID